MVGIAQQESIVGPVAETLTAPAKARPSKPQEIKPLTALRLFACLPVVIYHASEQFTCGHIGLDISKFTPVVTFFFVLSGFILTHNYFHLEGPRATLSFYLARIARMWPAHGLSLLLLVLILPELFKVTTKSLPLFLSNLFLVHSWIPFSPVYFSYNSPSWSNATEFFFYLCFPLLLLGMKRNWLFVLAATASLAVATISVCNFLHLPEFALTRPSYQALTFINPVARIFEFAVGMAAAIFYSRVLQGIRLNTIAGTVLEMLALAGVIFLGLNALDWRFAAVPWAGDAGALWLQNSGIPLLGCTFVISVIALERGLLAKILSTPLLVLLGDISFSIYMLHCVLLAYRGVNFPHDQSFSCYLLFWAVLLIGGHWMSSAVERPLRSTILKVGGSVIGSSRAPKVVPQSALSTFAKGGMPTKKILFLVGEFLLLAVLVYNWLPTIHRVSSEQSQVLASAGGVKNIDFPPHLRCESASAHVQDKYVSVKLLWKALKPGSADYFITAKIRDRQYKVIGEMSFLQDLRFQHVESDAHWFDDFQVPVSAPADAASVLVTVKKTKRTLLIPIMPDGSKPTDQGIVIPIT